MKKILFLIFFYASINLVFANFQPSGKYEIWGGGFGASFPMSNAAQKPTRFIEIDYGRLDYKNLYWYGFQIHGLYTFNNESQISFNIDGALTLGGWLSVGASLGLNLMYRYPEVFDVGLAGTLYTCFSVVCGKLNGNFFLEPKNSNYMVGFYILFWSPIYGSG